MDWFGWMLVTGTVLGLALFALVAHWGAVDVLSGRRRIPGHRTNGTLRYIGRYFVARSLWNLLR